MAAQAQFGVYGIYQGTSLTGIPCLSSTGVCSNQPDVGPLQPGDNKVDPTGGFGGIFYDFRSYGPIRLGVDLRAGELHANKSAVSSAGGKDITTAQSYLGGVRGEVRTPISWLKPYAEILFGYTRSDAAVPICETTTGGTYLCNGSVGTPAPRALDSYLQYEGLIGADIRITSFLDLRAPELGLGEMNQVGNSNNASTSSIGVRSVGAGIVLHLP